MGSILFGVLILGIIISRYDKWDVRRNPRGNITLNEIQDMFEKDNSNDKNKELQ